MREDVYQISISTLRDCKRAISTAPNRPDPLDRALSLSSSNPTENVNPCSHETAARFSKRKAPFEPDSFGVALRTFSGSVIGPVQLAVMGRLFSFERSKTLREDSDRLPGTSPTGPRLSGTTWSYPPSLVAYKIVTIFRFHSFLHTTLEKALAMLFSEVLHAMVTILTVTYCRLVATTTDVALYMLPSPEMFAQVVVYTKTAPTLLLDWAPYATYHRQSTALAVVQLTLGEAEPFVTAATVELRTSRIFSYASIALLLGTLLIRTFATPS